MVSKFSEEERRRILDDVAETLARTGLLLQDKVAAPPQTRLGPCEPNASAEAKVQKAQGRADQEHCAPPTRNAFDRVADLEEDVLDLAKAMTHVVERIDELIAEQNAAYSNRINVLSGLLEDRRTETERLRALVEVLNVDVARLQLRMPLEGQVAIELPNFLKPVN